MPLVWNLAETKKKKKTLATFKENCIPLFFKLVECDGNDVILYSGKKILFNLFHKIRDGSANFLVAQVTSTCPLQK